MFLLSRPRHSRCAGDQRLLYAICGLEPDFLEGETLLEALRDDSCDRSGYCYHGFF